MTGFDGSNIGVADKLSPRAIMECRNCWTTYNPEIGDLGQIEPGTPFVALPEDWSCPTCSAGKSEFLFRADPGLVPEVPAQIAIMVADFRDVFDARMRNIPLVNENLEVEAVGFREHEGRLIGVLVTPWFMNLVLLPTADEDWSNLVAGEKEYVSFASGDYEFLHNFRDLTGGYKACSLFSPMDDFADQDQAVQVAERVMDALFDPENRVISEAQEPPQKAMPSFGAVPESARQNG